MVRDIIFLNKKAVKYYQNSFDYIRWINLILKMSFIKKKGFLKPWLMDNNENIFL